MLRVGARRQEDRHRRTVGHRYGEDLEPRRFVGVEAAVWESDSRLGVTDEAHAVQTPDDDRRDGASDQATGRGKPGDGIVAGLLRLIRVVERDLEALVVDIRLE